MGITPYQLVIGPVAKAIRSTGVWIANPSYPPQFKFQVVVQPVMIIPALGSTFLA